MEDDNTKTIIIQDVRAHADADAPVKHEACLIVIAGGMVGMMHKLPGTGEIYIGRTADAAIQIDNDGVSRKHARISVTPDRKVVLSDLGSTNGTYVNGVKIVEQVLHDGDKVQIGPQTILKFQYQDALDEEFQRVLFESAVKDGLTGVYNKKYFLDRIQTDFAYAKRHHAGLALIMLDIDHFKKINDTHGHPGGDYVLKELAELVKRAIRDEDIFARFGGEEFALLMRDVDDENALMLAERLRRAVEQWPFEFGGRRISVTISLGVSTMNAGAGLPLQNPDDLVSCADKCLYDAKRAGRNRVAVRTGSD